VFEDVAEEGAPIHRVLTGDYASWSGRWEASQLAPGQVLQPAAPLFKKLDDAVVAQELARLGG
jgi:methionyl-tRNA synthetase